jgi:hypothetical protein
MPAGLAAMKRAFWMQVVEVRRQVTAVRDFVRRLSESSLVAPCHARLTIGRARFNRMYCSSTSNLTDRRGGHSGHEDADHGRRSSVCPKSS